jgi:hypothetical protein
MIKLSIVIPTYNSAKFIMHCLDSIFRQKESGIEVIIIDNASLDGTVDWVRKKYPQVKIMENKHNFGASQARNQGLKLACGEWVFILDCDVVLGENFLKIILAAGKRMPARVGMVQPKILKTQGKEIYSCGIRRSVFSRFHDIGRGLVDSGKFDIAEPIFGACCGAALYRRKMLEEIKDVYGYFDERFFFLFEDADLSWRGQKKGWICMYYPLARCYHAGNSSLMDGKTRQYLSFRNRQLTILKNQNPIIILLLLPLYLIYDLPRFLILAVKFNCKFPEFKYAS